MSNTALDYTRHRVENGTYATPFSSDVYNNSTRAKKRLAGVSLYGRSMVEMLGVLAIIGVLSVGALSGYSQAMWKYKKNKQTEQMNTVLNAIIRFKGDLRVNDKSNPNSQTSLVPYLRKLGELPEDMSYPQSHPYHDALIKDSFSNNWAVYHHGTGYLGLYVDIHVKGYGAEICKNLLEIAKPFHNDVSILIRNLNSSGTTNAHSIGGGASCKKPNLCLQNLTLQEIDDFCRNCGETSYCYFYYIIS